MSNGDGTGHSNRLVWAATVITIVGGIAGILTFILTSPKLVSEFFGDPALAPAVLAPSPALQAPLEDKFVVTPMSFGQDMTLSVRKGRTTDKGIITVFACSPDGHHHLMGETAYGTAPEDFVMGGRYAADAVTLIINVAPEDGDQKTVISKWNLDSLSRTKPPASRDGQLGCLDIRED